ncbi:MAG: ABC transporter ATP-binding protein [Spirochaetales bacterium]
MQETIVTVEHLDARFGSNQVLRGVSARFRTGEISVILGASGSGKTTILKHILGLMPIQSGRVEIFGRELNSLPDAEFDEIRTRLGMLFQEGALLNSISVASNTRVPIEQHTDLPDHLMDHMVMSKLRLVGLEKAAHILPNELSGGMRKRASLARALALDPELLLCDEPSSGLDPLTSESLDKLLIQLKDALGMTMIVISHDISSVRRVADRVFFLHKGEILFEGPMREAESSDIPELRRYFEAS